MLACPDYPQVRGWAKATPEALAHLAAAHPIR
jgi:hypothetical protein